MVIKPPYFDEDTKSKSFAPEGDENEIKERFIWTWSSEQQDCAGVIGAGINRMNIYVVRRATKAWPTSSKQGGADKGVAIA